MEDLLNSERKVHLLRKINRNEKERSVLRMAYTNNEENWKRRENTQAHRTPLCANDLWCTSFESARRECVLKSWRRLRTILCVLLLLLLLLLLRVTTLRRRRKRISSSHRNMQVLVCCLNLCFYYYFRHGSFFLSFFPGLDTDVISEKTPKLGERNFVSVTIMLIVNWFLVYLSPWD